LFVMLHLYISCLVSRNKPHVASNVLTYLYDTCNFEVTIVIFSLQNIMSSFYDCTLGFALLWGHITPFVYNKQTPSKQMVYLCVNRHSN
jgi:hypothetical protein